MASSLVIYRVECRTFPRVCRVSVKCRDLFAGTAIANRLFIGRSFPRVHRALAPSRVVTSDCECTGYYAAYIRVAFARTPGLGNASGFSLGYLGGDQRFSCIPVKQRSHRRINLASASFFEGCESEKFTGKKKICSFSNQTFVLRRIRAA